MFKILYQFICEEGILRNILFFENKDENIWQWIPFGFDNIDLHYNSGNGNTIKFDEGSLTFDHLGAIFKYYGKLYNLKRIK